MHFFLFPILAFLILVIIFWVIIFLLFCFWEITNEKKYIMLAEIVGKKLTKSQNKFLVLFFLSSLLMRYVIRLLFFIPIVYE